MSNKQAISSFFCLEESNSEPSTHIYIIIYKDFKILSTPHIKKWTHILFKNDKTILRTFQVEILKLKKLRPFILVQKVDILIKNISSVYCSKYVVSLLNFELLKTVKTMPKTFLKHLFNRAFCILHYMGF